MTQYGEFIRPSFAHVPEGPLRRFLNEIPTNSALSADQVDKLVATGRELLRNNAEYRRLLASLQRQPDAADAGARSTLGGR